MNNTRLLLSTAVLLSTCFSYGVQAADLGEATVESQVLQSVIAEAEHIQLGLTIDELAAGPSLVHEGDVLCRYSRDAEKLEEELKDAREALDAAERQYALFLELRPLEAESLTIELQQLERDYARAKASFEAWAAYERGSTLARMQQQFDEQLAQINDQRTELEQLEELYKEGRVHPATRDIVLDRARRYHEYMTVHEDSIKRSFHREYDFEVLRHDDRNRESWISAQENYLRQKNRLTEGQIRFDNEVSEQEKRIEEARETYENIIAESLIESVTAEASGIFIPSVELEDEVRVSEELGHVYRQGGQFSMQLPLSEIETLEVGQVLNATIGDLDDKQVEVTVTNIAWEGRSGRDGVQFNVGFEFDAEGVRPGMTIVVEDPTPTIEEIEEVVEEVAVEEVVEEAVDAAEETTEAVEEVIEEVIQEATQS